MRLRQVAFVAENLAKVREELFQLLGLSEDYADPGVGEFGLENSVMAIGDTFLEVVAPTQPGTTAGRLLERRGGDGGYMVLVQTDNIEFMRNHTESLKVRKIWEFDIADTKAFHLHPKDIGGAILSVDQMEPPQSWRWAGPDWESRQALWVSSIRSVSIQAQDPENMAKRWGKVLDESVQELNGVWAVMLEDASIVFHNDIDGRGEGLSALAFNATNLDAIRQQASKMNIAVEDSDNKTTLMHCGVRLSFISAAA
jgi:hypothetical protein